MPTSENVRLVLDAMLLAGALYALAAVPDLVPEKVSTVLVRQDRPATVGTLVLGERPCGRASAWPT